MTINDIEIDFRKKVSANVRLRQEGIGRYRVFTPFRFADGDHLAIVMKQEDAGWVLSDEGHTYMHLTYDIDEQDLKSEISRLISNALSVFHAEDHDGELRIAISDEQYGKALYSFIQALQNVLFFCYPAIPRTS